MSVIDKDSDRGGAIRAARKAAGFSQEHLAREANCSTAYVRLLEAGYAPGTSDVLPRMLEVLTSLAGSDDAA